MIKPKAFLKQTPGLDIKLLALSVLLVVTAASAQNLKHAPTVEHCRADAALWGEADPIIAYQNAQTVFDYEGKPNRTELSRLPLTEIKGRIIEMVDCRTVDNNDERYTPVYTFYSEMMADRLRGFIIRHNLMNQVLAEDAAGKR
jgi:hypothetical protein